MFENLDGSKKLLIASATAMGFGVFTFSNPIGLGALAIGTAGVITEGIVPLFKTLMEKGEYYEEVEKILKIIEINKIQNKNEESLMITEIRSVPEGFIVDLDIPLGLSYADIEKMIPAVSTAMGGKRVVLEKNSLKVYFTELKEVYELVFPPINKSKRNRLFATLGMGIDGLVELNLSQAGGILIAGQTGAGKSTVLRYILSHIAMNYTESEINLFLNDMKFTELSLFKDLKITRFHNTDPECVLSSLDYFWKEIQDRYKTFEAEGYTDAYEYEKHTGKKVPINLMVIEEFTILSGKKYKEEVELLNDILCQCIASKSHVIITTQRPDAKTLDPRLKANITHTIGLKTKSIINSQIICDEDVLKYLRGNGHGYLFDNKGDVEFQGFNLDPELAKEMLKKYKRDRKQNTNMIEKVSKSNNEIDNAKLLEQLLGDDEF